MGCSQTHTGTMYAVWKAITNSWQCSPPGTGGEQDPLWRSQNIWTLSVTFYFFHVRNKTAMAKLLLSALDGGNFVYNLLAFLCFSKRHGTIQWFKIRSLWGKVPGACLPVDCLERETRWQWLTVEGEQGSVLLKKNNYKEQTKSMDWERACCAWRGGLVQARPLGQEYLMFLGEERASFGFSESLLQGVKGAGWRDRERHAGWELGAANNTPIM